MKALISPNEVLIDKFDNEGCRIAQVETNNNTFDIAKPLFWVDCDEACNPNDYFYVNNEIIEYYPVILDNSIEILNAVPE